MTARQTDRDVSGAMTGAAGFLTLERDLAGTNRTWDLVAARAAGLRDKAQGRVVRDVTDGFVSGRRRGRGDWVPGTGGSPKGGASSADLSRTAGLSFGRPGGGARPRALLVAVRMAVTEMAEPEVRRGFEGRFRAKCPEMSGQVMRDKVRDIAAAKVPVVVAHDLGCPRHIPGRLWRARVRAHSRHLVGMLVECRGGLGIGLLRRRLGVRTNGTGMLGRISAPGLVKYDTISQKIQYVKSDNFCTVSFRGAVEMIPAILSNTSCRSVGTASQSLSVCPVGMNNSFNINS